MGQEDHHCCCRNQNVKRGFWSPEEDLKLFNYITAHGIGQWSSVSKAAGLQRCGKSCRLRWINYLRPDLKKGPFTEEEERIVREQHRMLGNKWSQIAKHVPGRTDNDVKNFWNSCIKKKMMLELQEKQKQKEEEDAELNANLPPFVQIPPSVFLSLQDPTDLFMGYNSSHLHAVETNEMDKIKNDMFPSFGHDDELMDAWWNVWKL